MPRFFYSPLLHLLMVASFLVCAPFLMLQNYLQQTVSQVSRATFSLGSYAVPILPLLVLTALGVVLVVGRRHITRVRVAASVACLLMIALAQQVCDVYANLVFFELQQNWHYFAYIVFAQFALRFFGRLDVPRRIAATWLLALAVSTFDEGFQMFINGRVFDPNDIAKDCWGAVIGLTAHLWLVHEGRTLGTGPVRVPRVRDLLTSARAVYALAFALALLLLLVTSLLSDPGYLGWALGVVAALFLVFAAALHVSQWRAGRWALGVAAILLVTGFAVARASWPSDQPVRVTPGITFVRGFPVPLFDVMLMPGGGWRPMDKRHHFNPDDRRFLLSRRADVLVLATGYDGSGGGGFASPGSRVSRLKYNPYTERPLQVIAMPTGEAVDVYNRLRKEGKDGVLLVVHHAL